MGGGTLTYEKDDAKRIKPENERVFAFSKDFPNCKGFYPDCPENPDLMCSMYRTCPKTDGMKKPKIED